jgi:hypothetical protein
MYVVLVSPIKTISRAETSSAVQIKLDGLYRSHSSPSCNVRNTINIQLNRLTPYFHVRDCSRKCWCIQLVKTFLESLTRRYVAISQNHSIGPFTESMQLSQYVACALQFSILLRLLHVSPCRASSFEHSCGEECKCMNPIINQGVRDGQGM